MTLGELLDPFIWYVLTCMTVALIILVKVLGTGLLELNEAVGIKVYHVSWHTVNSPKDSHTLIVYI